MFVAVFAQQHLVGFFVYPIIACAVFGFLALQHRRHLVHHLVEADVVVGLAGNNQRSARFVDQNGVDFVDHGKIKPALHFFGHIGHHIVTQVVEAEFVIGAVGDVRLISRLFVPRIHIAHNHAHA